MKTIINERLPSHLVKASPAHPLNSQISSRQYVVRAGRVHHKVPICMAQGGTSSTNGGGTFENKKRRKGRPAWTRSPDDSPYRDGNRDRLIGLLTLRSAYTLRYYLSETNLSVYHWFSVYMKENPIPKEGSWDDVSGETFLRKLLSMPVDVAKWNLGRDSMYDCTASIGVDPRQIAQRIMDIRSALAKEFIQDLENIAEENSSLMRDSLMESLSASLTSPDQNKGDGGSTHPEMNE